MLRSYDVMVSICCITYNHEKFIQKALDSFLMQKTNFSFEIVIHDDASTDKTQEIIKEYCLKHPNLFNPLLQKENQRSKVGGGMNPRFNYPRAKGKYIALCEGDDYWTDPYKLQKQVDLIEKYPQTSMCVALMKAHYESKNKIVTDTPYEGKNYPLIYLEDLNRYFHTSTYLIRNSIVTDILDKYLDLLIGDTAFRYLLLSKGPFVVLNDVVSVYRISGLGVWSKLPKHKQNLKSYKIAKTFRKEFIKEQRHIHLKQEFSVLKDIMGYYFKKKSYVNLFKYGSKYMMLLIRYRSIKEIQEVIKRF